MHAPSEPLRVVRPTADTVEFSFVRHLDDGQSETKTIGRVYRHSQGGYRLDRHWTRPRETEPEQQKLGNDFVRAIGRAFIDLNDESWEDRR